MYTLGETDTSFLEEVWILYGIGMTILLLRFAVRLRTVGIKGMQGDDAFALLVVAFYTIDAATVHNVYYMSTNVEGSVVQQARPLLDGEVSQLVEGSKQQLVAWYSYASLVWGLKAIMLCFFRRMTIGLSQQHLVKWLGLACVLTYVAVLLTITFGCFPYAHNWQVVPDPGSKCTLKPQNFLVMTVLNVLTDAAILYIPMPLLWTLRVPIRQKLVIGVLLSSGVFVITAALIRVVSTLSANPSALVINRWGVRETLVGIIAVNVPILRPLFSKGFWRPGPKTGSNSYPTHGSSARHTGLGAGPYEMAPSVHDSEAARQRADSLHGSEEHIISPDTKVLRKHKPSEGNVVIHTTYEVTSEERTQQFDPERRGFAEATATRKTPEV